MDLLRCTYADAESSAYGEGEQKVVPYGLSKKPSNLDSLRDQWTYLQQQSDNLRKKFPIEEVISMRLLSLYA